MKNIFIYGMSGSGKDTIANFLQSKYDFIKLRIAGTIKQYVYETYGFKSIKEFLERLKNSKNISMQSVENLIKSGAFDEIDKDRSELLNSFGNLYTQIVSKSKNELSGQLSLIGTDFMQENFSKTEKYSKDEILGFEKEILGFYISSHPLDDYKNYIITNNSMKLLDLKVLDKGIYKTIVYVNSVKTRRNKKNIMLKTVNVEDFSSSIELLDVKDLDIHKGQIYEISIKISVNSFGNTNFTIIDANEINEIYSKKLYIKLNILDTNSKKILGDLSEKYKGYNQVILYILSEDKTLKLENKFDLSNKDLIKYLENIFGKDKFLIN